MAFPLFFFPHFLSSASIALLLQHQYGPQEFLRNADAWVFLSPSPQKNKTKQNPQEDGLCFTALLGD